jgi:septum formation protein
VVCDGQIFGKPSDAEDARRMLRLLSGNIHSVITAICLRQGATAVVAHEETEVWFTPLTPEEIEDYVATGEPMDKAGAYGIQGIASRYIPRIEGSYSNVVGLPMSLVWREMQKLRISASPVTSTPEEA